MLAGSDFMNKSVYKWRMINHTIEILAIRDTFCLHWALECLGLELLVAFRWIVGMYLCT